MVAGENVQILGLLSAYQQRGKCNVVEIIFLNPVLYSTENINFKNVTAQASALLPAKAGQRSYEPSSCQECPARGCERLAPELEPTRNEARARRFGKGRGAGGERMPGSLSNHLHMSICFVTAVCFIPFQRAN